MRSRLLVLPFMILVVLTGTACSSPETSPPVWAAFTERGLDNLPMRAGANIRVFNEVTLDAQDSIRYDESNGHVTLQPGTYRFDGWSLTLFGYKLTPEQQATTFSAPGYAFLWNVDANRVEILGSMQDPLDSQLSIIDGVVEVPNATNYYLAHQNGKNVNGIQLRVHDPDITTPGGSPSTNHAFAQLVIERM